MRRISDILYPCLFVYQLIQQSKHSHTHTVTFIEICRMSKHICNFVYSTKYVIFLCQWFPSKYLINTYKIIFVVLAHCYCCCCHFYSFLLLRLMTLALKWHQINRSCEVSDLCVCACVCVCVSHALWYKKVDQLVHTKRTRRHIFDVCIS